MVIKFEEKMWYNIKYMQWYQYSLSAIFKFGNWEPYHLNIQPTVNPNPFTAKLLGQKCPCQVVTESPLFTFP